MKHPMEDHSAFQLDIIELLVDESCSELSLDMLQSEFPEFLIDDTFTCPDCTEIKLCNVCAEIEACLQNKDSDSNAVLEDDAARSECFGLITASTSKSDSLQNWILPLDYFPPLCSHLIWSSSHCQSI